MHLLRMAMRMMRTGLVLVDSNGARKLAFQQVERLERTTWPAHDVPMQNAPRLHGFES